MAHRPSQNAGIYLAVKHQIPSGIALYLNPAFTRRFATIPYLPVHIIKELNIRREECK